MQLQYSRARFFDPQLGRFVSTDPTGFEGGDFNLYRYTANNSLTHTRMLLNVGFIVLREAVQSGSSEWIKAEIEMLHNIPSLIGETNVHRHKYYWLQERKAYIEWIFKYGSDHAKSRMQTFYEPIWEAMSKDIEALVDKPIGAISA